MKPKVRDVVVRLCCHLRSPALAVGVVLALVLGALAARADNATASSDAPVLVWSGKSALEMLEKRGSRLYVDGATEFTITSPQGSAAASGSVVDSASSGLRYVIEGVEREPECAYSGPFTFGQRPDAMYYLLSWMRDSLGKSGPMSEYVVYLDNAPPKIEITADLKDSSGSLLIPESLVTILAEDAVSGVVRVEYRIDTGEFQDYAAPFEVGALGFGPHAVTCRATDHLGHVAEETFSFELSPAISVTKTRTLAPRTLVWWNEAAASVEERMAFEEVVAAASLTVDTVTTRDSFVKKLMTGGHNFYFIVGDAEPIEGLDAKVLAERVHLGAGLVSSRLERIDGPTLGRDREDGISSMARDNVLGVVVAGTYPARGPRTVLVESGTWQFAAAGPTPRVREVLDEVLARYETPGETTAAMTLRRYGLGRAVYVGFDMARLDSNARLIREIMDAAKPETEPVISGGVVALEIAVRSLVVPLNLTVNIEEKLPSDGRTIDIRPVPQTRQQDVISWYVVLDVGQETSVRYWMEVPDGVNVSEAVVSYLACGRYREFGRFGIEVRTLSRQELTESTIAALTSFAMTQPTRGGARQRCQQAAAAMQMLRTSSLTTRVQIESAMKDVSDAIEVVTRAADPAGTPLRRILGLLLETLGQEWSGAGE